MPNRGRVFQAEGIASEKTAFHGKSKLNTFKKEQGEQQGQEWKARSGWLQMDRSYRVL